MHSQRQMAANCQPVVSPMVGRFHRHTPSFHASLCFVSMQTDVYPAGSGTFCVK